MKPFHCLKKIFAVATLAAAGHFCQAQDQPLSPEPSTLPSDIAPGSPLAEVVKMAQAGVAADTIQSYIANSPTAFNLDADKIIVLKDIGLSSALVNTMLARDKTLYAGNLAPAPAPAPAPANSVASAPSTAPPTTEITVNDFNNTLSPYGSWVEIEGYGRCWRPTVVVYDAGWRPYGDRGRWIYTDHGWYWDSDYSWGVTFHYGRWFRHAQFGWCWYPDTVWAPSWVTWRSGGTYCGWAPLPPLTVYRPGVGFSYRGGRVAVDFDFGLDAGCFIFVAPDHFGDRHPRSFAAPPERVKQIFHQTTIINNYNVNNNGNSRTIVNHGIPVQQISGATHRAIEPVRVGSLPNAGRQGWHGMAENNPVRNTSNDNSQLRHGSVPPNNSSHNEPVNLRQNTVQPVSNHQLSTPPSQVNQPSQPGRSEILNRSQPTANDHAQSPKVITTAPVLRTTTAPNTTAPNEWRQNRNTENPTSPAPQQHGAIQLKQPVTPNSNYSRQPSYSTPIPTAPEPSHNAGSDQNSGKDKQNH